MAKVWPRTALIGFLVTATAGCSSLDWFDDSEEILPGERIAIMAIDNSLEADPRIADLRVTLAEAKANQSWEQSGGNPTHAMGHLALNGVLKRAWTADVGDGVGDDRFLLGQPLIVDGVVYTMDSRSVVSAFSADTGKQVWQIDLEPEEEDDGYFGGGVAYHSGRVFVTTGFAEVVALDGDSGELLWRHGVPAPLRAAPTAVDGRVFAVTVENQLVAISASQGERLWQHNGISETTGILGAASPAVEGSIVIVPYSSGEIFALLVENGRLLWNDTLAAIRPIDPIADLADIEGQPVIAGGLVYAISHSGRMIATDLRRGSRAWDIDIGGVQTPWVSGDFIYVVTNQAQVVCLTRLDGRIRWVTALSRFEDAEDQEGLIQWYGPVLAGGRLMVAGSHGEAVFLSPYDGEVQSSLDLPGGAVVPPAVAANSLYILTAGADLVAFR